MGRKAFVETIKRLYIENIQSVSYEQKTHVFMIIDDTVNKKCVSPHHKLSILLKIHSFIIHTWILNSMGHQIIQSMIKADDASYPLAFEIYNNNNEKSKINIAIDMINKLPYLSDKTYLLCDK